MKIVATHEVIANGRYKKTARWKALRADIHAAVKATVWPRRSKDFAIYPELGKKRGQGNGVKPLKNRAISELTKGGDTYGKRLKAKKPPVPSEWIAEVPWSACPAPVLPGAPPVVGTAIAAAMPGKIDLVHFGAGSEIVAVEWETGNISSSHRSINKICLALLTKRIKAGVLIVPSRDFAQYLTDRVGNINELQPYFELWKSVPFSDGLLEIIVIEHDRTSMKVGKIPKGTDGRAVT